MYKVKEHLLLYFFFMKILIIYIIVVFGLSSNLIAQYNYVPNSSFEEYDTCPDGLTYLTPSCDDWFDPCALMSPEPPSPFSINGMGSADYYHICSTNPNSSIPNNLVGFQYPLSGSAYSGFALLSRANLIYTINGKEYIEVELKKKLVFGREYCLEFHYSIAKYGSNYDYSVFNIGALLTDTLQTRVINPNTLYPANIIATPQVQKKLLNNKDTINWIKVKSNFVSNGTENWLTIGNFQNTDTNITSGLYVYVYIDDVKLYYCGPDTTPQPTDSMIVPNVFTPNDDGINDKFEFKNQEQWEYETQIFNRWGHLIFDNSKSENWDGYLNGVQATPGVYYYVIRAAAIKTGKVVVYRGTVTVLY